MCGKIQVPKAFTVAEYDRYKPYKSLETEDGVLERRIRQFRAEIEKDSPDDNCPYLVLYLAQQLKSVSRPYTKRLFSDIQEGNDLPEEVITYLATTSEDKEAKNSDGKPSIEDPIDQTKQESDEKQQEVEKIKGIRVGKSGSKLKPDGTLSLEEKVFYPYLAAYLLRMVSKTDSNAKAGMDNLFLRFTSFYSRKPPTKKVMSDSWFKLLKTLMASDPTIAVTWVKTFVPYEAKEDMDSSDVGLVRYLATLPLSYTGMHAYKLFGDIKSISKLNNVTIIHGMTHALTVPGLKDIVLILNKFEKQMPEVTPAREYNPAFKYSRILSSQFFVNLQTKSCPALVYVLAELLGKYRVNNNPLQNPANIIGMSSIPDATKAALKDAVERFYQANQTRKDDQVSPYMAAAFSAKATPVVRIGTTKSGDKPHLG